MLILLLKSILLVVCAILYRSTLPRYRIDQLIALNWKHLIYFLIYFYIYLFLLLILFN